MFAIHTLTGFVISPGPSSADGATVVAYYTAHGDAAIWQACSRVRNVFASCGSPGRSLRRCRRRTMVLVSAGAMAAIYLVTLGAWEALAETYKGVDTVESRAKATTTPMSFTSRRRRLTHGEFRGCCLRRRDHGGATEGSRRRDGGDSALGRGWSHGRLADQCAMQIFGLRLVGRRRGRSSSFPSSPGCSLSASSSSCHYAAAPRRPCHARLVSRANANDGEVAFVRDFARSALRV